MSSLRTWQKRGIIFDRGVYLSLLALLFLFAFDALAVYFSWYWTYLWLDIPVHLTAGLILSLVLYYLVYPRERATLTWRKEKKSREVFSTMVFWVLVIAISWEILEFIAGRTFLSSSFAPDLFLDIVATSLGSLLGYALLSVWGFGKEKSSA